MNARSDLRDSAFLKAARGEPVPHTPVWFMRQAGRSLPEYRELRAGVAMLESCRRPELVREITLQPVRRHGVDAAVLFSDIVVPVAAAGMSCRLCGFAAGSASASVRGAGRPAWSWSVVSPGFGSFGCCWLFGCLATVGYLR